MITTIFKIINYHQMIITISKIINYHQLIITLSKIINYHQMIFRLITYFGIEISALLQLIQVFYTVFWNFLATIKFLYLSFWAIMLIPHRRPVRLVISIDIQHSLTSISVILPRAFHIVWNALVWE